MTNQDQSSTDDKTTFIGWEPETEEVDFFGTTTEVTTLVSEEEKKKKPTEKAQKEETTETSEESTEATTTEEEEEENGDSFFGIEEKEESTASNLSEEEEEDDDTSSTETTEHVVDSSVGALSFLKDKGIVDYELEEDEELTEERASELLEESYESSVEGRVQELFEDLPQVVKDMNKFVLDGGNIRQFLGSLVQGNATKIDSDLDLSEEANQELVVRASLEGEEYDKEYIDTHIEFLKDSKKLEKFAKAKFDKIEKAKETERKALLKQQTAAKTARVAALKESKATLVKNLKDIEDVEGLPLTSKEKKELPSYMVDRNIKLQNGGTITTMQMDLMEALKDEKKALFIAKLLRTDFDLTALKKGVQSKVTRKIKDKIRRNEKDSKNVKSTGGASPISKKALSDYF